MDQNKTPIFDAIIEYGNKQPAYFRIPGHRFEHGISEKWTSVVGDGIFRFDLTETPMLDDLHAPEGAILEAEKLAAEVFGSDMCFFLVNGTTSGNEAMITTTASENSKIAIPRNAHKSAFMGLVISGAKPVYIMPEIDPDTGLHGGVTLKTVHAAFDNHPGLKGVMIVSPTYYGLCSDIKSIANVCHEHNAALLVDEAHGAHLYFSDRLPGGAIEQNADMCAQSIHKVTGSLTQSSMLQVRSDLVNIDLLKKALTIVQSTSPSYLLMTSLDLARYELATRGESMIANAIDLADYAREAISKLNGIHCLGTELEGKYGVKQIDPTRLVINAANLGLTGFELKHILFDRYSVDLELADHMNALAIVTYANTKDDIHRLVSALTEISIEGLSGTAIKNDVVLPSIPPMALTPREAFFATSRSIPWSDAIGKIAAESVAPYPPGIPAIYPGEIMTKEIWEYLERFRREVRHIHGPSDPSLTRFRIIDR